MFLAVGVVAERPMLVFTNRFSPDGGEPAPDGSARLLSVGLWLPSADAVHALAERLSAAGYSHELSADVLRVRDPSGNLLVFTTSATDAQF